MKDKTKCKHYHLCGEAKGCPCPAYEKVKDADNPDRERDQPANNYGLI